MTCVCGHSDDLHEECDDEDNVILEGCKACICTEFCGDDRDELEIE
jgi:hypothetical protein